ncbi:MAG: RNA polymerase sigma factor [Planctomycetota bacterium]|nr:RNA polymerase sigma factor [Planctomycetota bacterium]
MDDRRILADSLMSRAAGGDRDAFGRLAEITGAAVYHFCLAHLPPRMRYSAADVRQECFLRAWRDRKRFRTGGNAVAWLMGIALNVVREHRRKFRPALPLDNFDPSGKNRNEDERLEQLSAAVDALPARQREAVICRFFGGMSVAETAAAMGCAEGTVKAAVFKAVENLQRIMNQQEP